jgi:hypothetical protein
LKQAVDPSQGSRGVLNGRLFWAAGNLDRRVQGVSNLSCPRKEYRASLSQYYRDHRNQITALEWSQARTMRLVARSVEDLAQRSKAGVPGTVFALNVIVDICSCAGAFALVI